MEKNQKAVMLAFVALILLIITLFMPWYGTYSEVEVTDDDGETTRRDMGMGGTLSLFIGPMGGGATATIYGGYAVNWILTFTAILVVLALIFTGLFFMSTLFRFLEKSSSMGSLRTFGILDLIFCILAPIIFMIGLPGAIKADEEESAEYSGGEYEEPDHDYPSKNFFGSYEDTEEDYWDGSRTVKYSWGGDIGWFLAFITFIILLVAFIMARSTAIETAPVQPPYTEPVPYQPPSRPMPSEPAPRTPARLPQQRMPPTRVTCPGCKNIISVRAASFPAPIKCPHCGMRGFIE